jgi:hypothetical protein
MPNLRLPAERWTLGRDSRARAMEEARTFQPRQG